MEEEMHAAGSMQQSSPIGSTERPAGHSSSEVFEMALSLTTHPQPDIDQHFRELLCSLEDTAASGGEGAELVREAERKLRRLQQMVRQRLDSTPRARMSPQAHLRPVPPHPTRRNLTAGWALADGRQQQRLHSLVSRVQRSFRASRLAVPHSASSRRHAALAIERFYLKRRGPYLSHNARAAALKLEEQGSPSAVNLNPNTNEQVLTTSPQTTLYTPSLTTYSRGERDPSLITYHAERRERAARCIQGYLLRQQRKEDAAPDGGVDRCVYTEEQLFLIRRAQRAFRAHIKQHAKEAKAT
ncbi:MAG: hypothetical protein SGPRY_004272 [Prymnesium sp.]